jgi:hypothetical protein
MGTRTGGIIIQAYLLAALVLCALEYRISKGRLSRAYVIEISARYAAVVLIAWLTAIAIWPWLQVGNPLHQFEIAYLHFAKIPLSFDFPHWGRQVSTDALPWSYIPGQLSARLPLVFILLLIIAAVAGALSFVRFMSTIAKPGQRDWRASLLALAFFVARQRAVLVACAAIVLPVAFLVIQRATLYDGVRHVLFVIPMLAIIAGAGFSLVLPWLARAPVLAAALIGTYLGASLNNLAVLHPLEYIAMNAAAGGIEGAYDRFELDYWSLAATEALRRLEHRLDYDSSLDWSEAPPRLLICIPSREAQVAPMFHRRWILETDPLKANYVIATERSRCAAQPSLVLIDEVTRFGRTFAWTYKRQ